jgi:hypothetical protein
VTRKLVVIDLILKKLSLVAWNRISCEEPGDMLSESLIDIAIILDELEMVIIVFDWNSIVVLIHDVIMIRNVVINSTVARLWNVVSIFRITLLLRSAIGRLLNNRPP